MKTDPVATAALAALGALCLLALFLCTGCTQYKFATVDPSTGVQQQGAFTSFLTNYSTVTNPDQVQASGMVGDIIGLGDSGGAQSRNVGMRETSQPVSWKFADRTELTMGNVDQSSGAREVANGIRDALRFWFWRGVSKDTFNHLDTREATKVGERTIDAKRDIKLDQGVTERSAIEAARDVELAEP